MSKILNLKLDSFKIISRLTKNNNFEQSERNRILKSINVREKKKI